MGRLTNYDKRLLAIFVACALILAAMVIAGIMAGPRDDATAPAPDALVLDEQPKSVCTFTAGGVYERGETFVMAQCDEYSAVVQAAAAMEPLVMMCWLADPCFDVANNRNGAAQ